MGEIADRAVLPDNVEPTRYKLYLTPDLAGFVYDGKVVIDVVTKEPTNRCVSCADFLRQTSVTGWRSKTRATNITT